MDFETTFPARYVLNLGTRWDRRHEVEFEFLRHRLDVVRQPAVNSRWLKSAWGYPSKEKYACGLSKCLAVRRARKERAEAVIIFEDDVVFCEDFTERLAGMQLPADWGVFFLGCRHVERPVPVLGHPGLVRVAKARDNHAVAIRAPYFQRAIRLMRGVRKHEPSDGRSSDGVLGRLCQEVPTYAAFPNLAWQRACYSDLQRDVYTNYDEAGSQIQWPEAVTGLAWEMENPGQRWADRHRQPILPAVAGNPRVECIVVAWRAENLEPILRAFRNQTVPCRTTVVVANRMANGEAVPESALGLADRVLRITEDFGAYNRFLPAFACDQEFVYLHDDDMLPGPRCLEHFLKAADSIGHFGVLGQEGRQFPGGNRYSTAAVKQAAQPQPVDMVVRGYFVPACHLPVVLQARHSLRLKAGDDLEDDLILAYGMKSHGLPTYVTALDPDPASSNCIQELGNAAARHRRADHFEKRDRFVREHMTEFFHKCE
jgi:hypothetical protein